MNNEMFEKDTVRQTVALHYTDAETSRKVETFPPSVGKSEQILK